MNVLNEDTERRSNPTSTPLPRPKFALLLLTPTGPKMIAVAPGEVLTLGRGDDADLCIDDSELSRRHLKVTVTTTGMELEDLGSTNGTHFDGCRVDRCTLLPGQEVRMGRSVLGFQGVSRVQPTPDHESFLDWVNRELERTKLFSRPFVLALFRTKVPDPGFWNAVLGRLRPIDVSAHYAPKIIEVLLPETSAIGARGMLASALAGKEAAGVLLECNGRGSASDLLGRMLKELRATDSGEVRILELEEEASLPVIASACTRLLHAQCERLSRSKVPVLVTGETGVGKEVIAGLLHRLGSRRKGPFVAINCGAIPPGLVEATFFGHEAGAFTQAIQSRPGLLEAAHLGTLFLDEIGEMPLETQAVLLRILDGGRVTRIGSHAEVPVDVRIVSATNRDLGQLVQERRFREDLYYRLSGVTLEVPPLRQRREEIQPLVSMFLQESARESSVPIPRIDASVMETFMHHPWPGNIRELKGVIQRAIALSDGDRITLDALPPRMWTQTVSSSALSTGETLSDRVAAVESATIRRALEDTSYSVKLAAERLGIPVRTLNDKITRLGLSRRPG